MFNTFLASLNTWNATKSERQKLQHSFLVLTGLIIVASGVISLFNGQVGHDIVVIALFTSAVFLANALVWNLLQSAVLSKLTSKSKHS